MLRSQSMAEPPLGTLAISSGQGRRRFVRPSGAIHAPRAFAPNNRRRETSVCARPFNDAVNSITLPGVTTLVPKWSRWAWPWKGTMNSTRNPQGRVRFIIASQTDNVGEFVQSQESIFAREWCGVNKSWSSGSHGSAQRQTLAKDFPGAKETVARNQRRLCNISLTQPVLAQSRTDLPLPSLSSTLMPRLKSSSTIRRCPIFELSEPLPPRPVFCTAR